MKPRDVKVVLCGGIRTPIGHFAKSLAKVSPEHLMMITINGLLAHTKLYPHAVDGVMVGWVGQGSHAPNIARIAVLMSHLPEKAHAVTLQANCVSGMEAISSAARHIIMGEGDLYIAGGTESMSMVPMGGNKISPNPWLVDNYPDAYINMGLGTENIARKFGITRETADAFAANSHKKAVAAIAAGAALGGQADRDPERLPRGDRRRQGPVPPAADPGVP